MRSSTWPSGARRCGRAKRGVLPERSEALCPSEARSDPELREGFKRKLEATKRGATQLPRPNADSCFSGFVGTARAGFPEKRPDAGFSFSRLEELCS